MKTIYKSTALVVAIVLPGLARSQDSGLASGIGSLQTVLDQLYNDMLPLCGQMIGIGQAIAGFAALWFIAVRVWRHISNAEPVDVFPLLQPFVTGFAIVIFPSVIALINGVLSPTVTGTAQMLGSANGAISTLLQQKQDALSKTVPYQIYNGEGGNGNEALWELYSGNNLMPLGSMLGPLEFQLSKAYYNFKNTVKEWLSEILQVLYEAASLCINTIRTFNLIVLAILGPLVFGLSVFDGFQHTLRAWLARYIQVFLWLPVANIFGAIIANIQTRMLQLDINQLQANGSTYFSPTDIAYLVFLIIGIFGYLTVPSVAAYVVNAGGGSPLSKAGSMAGAAAMGAVRSAGGVMSAPSQLMAGYREGGGNGDSLASRAGRAYGQARYQRNKVSGNNDNR